ncbi:MAG: DinB family protein [Bacteroidetes bacterium]|nr:DinB family protein [Bacteroidota bacterium]
MVARTKWIERQFNFDFPPGVFPNIVERLRGTPARLEDICSNLNHDQMITQIDGAWSVQEHVGHLWDLEELHEGRLDDFLNGAERLRPADMTNKKTYDATHNENTIEELMKSFRKTRMSFIERLEQLNDDQISLTAQHPRLNKPMRLVDMVYFAAEHDDHHIAGISIIVNSFG